MGDQVGDEQIEIPETDGEGRLDQEVPQLDTTGAMVGAGHRVAAAEAW